MDRINECDWTRPCQLSLRAAHVPRRRVHLPKPRHRGAQILLGEFLVVAQIPHLHRPRVSEPQPVPVLQGRPTRSPRPITFVHSIFASNHIRLFARLVQSHSCIRHSRSITFRLHRGMTRALRGPVIVRRRGAFVTVSSKKAAFTLPGVSQWTHNL